METRAGPVAGSTTTGVEVGVMRWLAVIAVVAALASGCGPSFDSDAEELAYLKALSNPTPGQWKRRNELAEKSAAESDRAASDAATAADRAKYPGMTPAQIREAKARESDELQDSAARRDFDDAKAAGAKYEGQGENGLAARCFLDFAKKHQGHPLARDAYFQGRRLWRLAYGDLPLP